MTANQIPIATATPPPDVEDETTDDEEAPELDTDVTVDLDAPKSATFPSSPPPEKTFACATCGEPAAEQHQLVNGNCQPCNSKLEAGFFLSPQAKNNNALVVNAINNLAKIVAKSIGQDQFDALNAEVADG